MRIIPAIDIIDGKCVRLSRGDFNRKTIYNDNPVEVAKAYEDNGIKYLHLVDLDGAKNKHIINHHILYQIATVTKLSIDFGGGIKSNEDIKIAFENGAQQITGGSIAVSNPRLFQEWVNRYGAEKIILGADCNNEKIATNGWQHTSELNVIEFIKDYKNIGIQKVICTDIAKDGMLQGPSIDLYKRILSSNEIQLIASGGIHDLVDLETLDSIGCEGAIIGKAIYEGFISLKQLQKLC